MSLDLNQIKNYYSQIDDAKLERIAKSEVASLEQEVVAILVAEIRKRNLNERLLTGIEAQSKVLSEEEMYALRDKVRGLDCPSCGKSNQGLVGGIIRKVRGYLLFSQYETRPMIACSSCVDRERQEQLMKNSILGWWSFPWGLLYRTPQAIINHYRDNKKKEEISASILLDFATRNVGELKTNWENEEELVNFIHYFNTT